MVGQDTSDEVDESSDGSAEVIEPVWSESEPGRPVLGGFIDGIEPAL